MEAVPFIARWIGACALFLAAAVMLGAFGAHGLRDRLDAAAMGYWEKAVFYHVVHALAAFITALLVPMNLISSSTHKGVSLLFLGGVVVFSGSLYLLALTGMRWLGAVTPLGGTAFIAAWLWLAYATLRA